MACAYLSTATYCLSVCLWAIYLTFMHLNFLIFKTRMIIAPTLSGDI